MAIEHEEAMDKPEDFIEGAHRLVEWFGRFPTFHDCETLDIGMDRRGPSIVMRSNILAQLEFSVNSEGSIATHIGTSYGLYGEIVSTSATILEIEPISPKNHSAVRSA